MTSTGSKINRTALIQSLIAMGLLMPGMLLFPLGISLAMCLFIYGVMLGFLVVILMDVRRALLMAGAFTVINLLAYAAAPHPLLAALVMAVAVLIYGLTLRIGLATFIVVAPISVAFTTSQPPNVLPHSSQPARAGGGLHHRRAVGHSCRLGDRTQGAAPATHADVVALDVDLHRRIDAGVRSRRVDCGSDEVPAGRRLSTADDPDRRAAWLPPHLAQGA